MLCRLPQVGGIEEVQEKAARMAAEMATRKVRATYCAPHMPAPAWRRWRWRRGAAGLPVLCGVPLGNALQQQLLPHPTPPPPAPLLQDIDSGKAVAAAGLKDLPSLDAMVAAIKEVPIDLDDDLEVWGGKGGGSGLQPAPVHCRTPRGAACLPASRDEPAQRVPHHSIATACAAARSPLPHPLAPRPYPPPPPQADFKAEKISAETVVLGEDGKPMPLPAKKH
jgi:hypothetical protein